MGNHLRIILLLAVGASVGCEVDLTTTPELMHPYAATGLVAEPMPDWVRLGVTRYGETEYERIDKENAPPVVHDAGRPTLKKSLGIWVDDQLNNQSRHLFNTDKQQWINAVIDRKHNVFTEFESPLVNVDSTLAPGESVTVETRAIVRDLDDRDRIKDRGDCTSTLTYDGSQKLNTPAGTFKCYRFTSEYSAKFRLAKVTNTAVAWYADEVGLVAKVYNERITAVFVPLTKSYAIVLSKPPQ